ncbi:MAG: M16 family metallopeptidase [Hyphomicrobiaceae bacterium]
MLKRLATRHRPGSWWRSWTARSPLMAMMVALLMVWANFPAGADAGLRPVKHITTASGLSVWLVEEPGIPLVAIRFAFSGGALQDPPGLEGLAVLMANLMTEGAGPHRAEDFARHVADHAARISIAASRDRISGALDVLSSHLDASAALLRMALSAPRFDADAVERARAQLVSTLAIASNDPRATAFERWYAAAFPGHPSGRPVNGTLQSVARITRGDIAGHHTALITRDRLRVVIVGDIRAPRASLLVDEVFAGLPITSRLKEVNVVAPLASAAPLITRAAQPLSTAVFGLPGLSPHHPDYAALQVLNHFLGSGDFDSRLMEEIRVKRGLAYSVQARLTHDAGTPLLVGSLATRNDTMAQALRVLRETLSDVAERGVPSEQLNRTQQYLTASYPLDFDTNSGTASALLQLWLEGRAPEYLAERNAAINSVSAEDVHRVARDVLRSDRLLITIVGQPTP